MATVMSSDKKLEKLKMEILETFEELSNYLSVHKQKLLSRLIRIKEGYDRNTEIDSAIEQLKSVRDTALKVMKSNLLEKMGEDFDNRLKNMEDTKVHLDFISFRCYSDKIRKYIDEIDLIEEIPEYVGREHPIISKCKAGNGKSDLYNPRGVAFDKIQNKLYICDSSNCRIQVFNTDGEFLHSFGNDQLLNPFGICVSKDSVFVSDNERRCVKFTLEGVFKMSSEGLVNFNKIYGIDCCDKLLYICDFSVKKIHVFDLNLKHIREFGLGKLRNPVDISIHSDRIYILTQSFSSIYCYSKDCTFQNEIKLSGGENPMTISMYMVIDPKGNFLISDSSNREVRIFSPQGILKHSIGKGHFYMLSGLALDNSNNIICLNFSTGSDCFQKY